MAYEKSKPAFMVFGDAAQSMIGAFTFQAITDIASTHLDAKRMLAAGINDPEVVGIANWTGNLLREMGVVDVKAEGA